MDYGLLLGVVVRKRVANLVMGWIGNGGMAIQYTVQKRYEQCIYSVSMDGWMDG